MLRQHCEKIYLIGQPNIWTSMSQKPARINSFDQATPLIRQFMLWEFKTWTPRRQVFDERPGISVESAFEIFTLFDDDAWMVDGSPTWFSCSWRWLSFSEGCGMTEYINLTNEMSHAESCHTAFMLPPHLQVSPRTTMGHWMPRNFCDIFFLSNMWKINKRSLAGQVLESYELPFAEYKLLWLILMVPLPTIP